jgi:hypothetical protein
MLSLHRVALHTGGRFPQIAFHAGSGVACIVVAVIIMRLGRTSAPGMQADQDSRTKP